MKNFPFKLTYYDTTNNNNFISDSLNAKLFCNKILSSFYIIDNMIQAPIGIVSFGKGRSIMLFIKANNEIIKLINNAKFSI